MESTSIALPNELLNSLRCAGSIAPCLVKHRIQHTYLSFGLRPNKRLFEAPGIVSPSSLKLVSRPSTRMLGLCSTFPLTILVRLLCMRLADCGLLLDQGVTRSIYAFAPAAQTYQLAPSTEAQRYGFPAKSVWGCMIRPSERAALLGQHLYAGRPTLSLRASCGPIPQWDF